MPQRRDAADVVSSGSLVMVLGSQWSTQMHEQTELIMAMERAYAALSDLRDVIYGNDWDSKLETAMADFVLKAAALRNRFEELA